jgi:hypothetical protein
MENEMGRAFSTHGREMHTRFFICKPQRKRLPEVQEIAVRIILKWILLK